MSRIGNLPIDIPAGVELTVDKGIVKVKGPKGELFQKLKEDITVSVEDGLITVSRPTNQKRHKAFHGLYRSLINNMVIGVSQGYVKEMELIGVGFRVANKGQLLELSLGFSHPIMFYIPDEVKVETAMEKGKPPYIKLESIDKELIGHIAAKIRAFKKPEPYKGKGIRFKGEEIKRKVGKTAE